MGNENRIERLKEIALKEGIRFYTPSPKNDMLLVKWWMVLMQSEDIDHLIDIDSQPLHPFLSLFKHPTFFLYDADENGDIVQAHWFKGVSNIPNESTVNNAVWCLDSLRGSLRQMLFTYLTYSMAFCFCTAIVSSTWQPKLLDLHIKMGYDVVGMIPDFIGRKEYYLVRLTKEKFEQSRFYATGTKLVERKQQ